MPQVMAKFTFDNVENLVSLTANNCKGSYAAYLCALTYFIVYIRMFF